MKIIIIPGGQIISKNKVGPSLLARCEEALKVFEGGGFDYILTTGGFTNPKSVQTLSEARIVKEWLISRGVCAEKIISEEKSLDSFGNVEFGLEAIEKKGFKPDHIVVVSQWQHTIRYWITLKLGYKISAKVSLRMIRYPIGIKGMLIEFLFILYHLIDPRGRKKIVKKYREIISKKIKE